MPTIQSYCTEAVEVFSGNDWSNIPEIEGAPDNLGTSAITFGSSGGGGDVTKTLQCSFDFSALPPSAVITDISVQSWLQYDDFDSFGEQPDFFVYLYAQSPLQISLFRIFSGAGNEEFLPSGILSDISSNGWGVASTILVDSARWIAGTNFVNIFVSKSSLGFLFSYIDAVSVTLTYDLPATPRFRTLMGVGI